MTRTLALLALLAAACGSPTARDGAPPPSTTGLAAAVGRTTVTLTWTNPAQAARLLLVRYPGSVADGAPERGRTYLVGDAVGHGIVVQTGGALVESFLDAPGCGLFTWRTFVGDTAGRWSDDETVTAEVLALVEKSPTGLTLAADGETVTLTWDDPDRDPSFDHTALVRRAEAAPGAVDEGTVLYRGVEGTFVDTGLEPGLWFYAVFACNACGACEASGDQASARLAGPDTTPPGDVVAATFLPGDAEVSIAWNQPADADLAGVRIVRSLSPGLAGPDDGELVCDPCFSPTVDSGLVNGTTYHYGVWAYDAAGNFASGVFGSATPSSAIDTTPPPEVEGAAFLGGDGFVGLSWSEPLHPDFAGVRIVRSESGDPAGPLDGVLVCDACESPVADTGLVNGTPYYYRVHTYDLGGNFSAGTPGTAVPKPAAAVALPAPTGAPGFGRALAADGDWVVVGAPEDAGSGAVYVYQRTAAGWGPGARLAASVPVPSAGLGGAVAISGLVVAAGAASEDTAAGSTAGAVHVFERDASGTFAPVARLVSPEAERSANFGSAVALDGNLLVVGEYDKTEAGHRDAGVAWVFVRSGPGGAFDAGTKLVASDLSRGDRFGRAAAADGDIVVVGAFSEDGGAGDPLVDAGAAYVFERDLTGAFVETAILRAPDAAARAQFGFSVDVDGDHVVVGARQADAGTRSMTGAAYVFRRPAPGVWDAGTRLPDSVEDDFGYLGWSVAVDGSRIAASAVRSEASGIDDAGVVHLFDLAGGVWLETDRVVSPGAARNGYFGHAVALSGGRLLATAEGEPGGAAYSLDLN